MGALPECLSRPRQLLHRSHCCRISGARARGCKVAKIRSLWHCWHSPSERMRSHWEKIKSTDLNRVKRRGSNKQARKVTPKGQNKKRKKK